MQPAQHAALTDRFVAWAERTDSVVALVGVGSTSGLRPADRWSDHDLLIVTSDPDQAASLRREPGRLPLPSSPLLVFAEPDHGLTIILADGHLLELAICGPDELSWFAAEQHRVLVDRIGVATILDEVLRARVASTPPDTVEAQARCRHLIKELIVVIGRLGRGERISAHRHLHAALDDLLVLLRLTGDVGAASLSDPFDPARRLERTDPDFAAWMDAALSLPLEHAVAEILDLVAARVIPTCGCNAQQLQAQLEQLLDEALGETVSSGQQRDGRERPRPSSPARRRLTCDRGISGGT